MQGHESPCEVGLLLGQDGRHETVNGDFPNLNFHHTVLSHNGAEPGTEVRVSLTRRALKRTGSDRQTQQGGPGLGSTGDGAKH